MFDAWLADVSAARLSDPVVVETGTLLEIPYVLNRPDLMSFHIVATQPVKVFVCSGADADDLRAQRVGATQTIYAGSPIGLDHLVTVGLGSGRWHVLVENGSAKPAAVRYAARKVGSNIW